jgi:hypothetical protein
MRAEADTSRRALASSNGRREKVDGVEHHGVDQHASERHDFEQRLIEEIADEIAAIAANRFEELAGRQGGRVFVMNDGEKVKLVAVDHYDAGGLLITVEAEDGRRYLVRFEIRSGHYAVEAVPLDDV